MGWKFIFHNLCLRRYKLKQTSNSKAFKTSSPPTCPKNRSKSLRKGELHIAVLMGLDHTKPPTSCVAAAACKSCPAQTQFSSIGKSVSSIGLKHDAPRKSYPTYSPLQSRSSEGIGISLVTLDLSLQRLQFFRVAPPDIGCESSVASNCIGNHCICKVSPQVE
eukprot:5804498-Amphidinium_carterae.2